MLERGVDVISESDDIAGIDGPFWPPRLMKQYLWPPIQHVVKMAHRKGVAYTKHSDGNLWPILDDLVEVGFDGIHPIQPQCMDLREAKDHLKGKSAVLGNIDCTFLLPFGSEEEVDNSVKEAIKTAAPGGGYIISSSNSIHPGVKAENYIAMVKAARKYGSYPINL